MEGIGIIRFYEEGLKRGYKEMIANLTKVRKKIIILFGETAMWMYGLIQKNCLEV